MSDELRELAESIFAGTAQRSSTRPGVGFDAPLWKTLEGSGLARLTLPEAAGGSGGSLADAAVLLTAAGAHAARVPLVETDLLAGWLLHTAGIALPAGPLSAVVADLDVSGDRVAGTLRRVPWARAAAGVVVLTPAHVVLLDPEALVIVDGTNLAEEPREKVIVGEPYRGVRALAVVPAPAGAAAQFRLRAALGRAQLLAGAARGGAGRFGALCGGAGAVRATDRALPGGAAAAGAGRRGGGSCGRGGRSCR